MGMREPFVIRAHHATTYVRLVDGRLEIEGVPLSHGLGNRLGVGLAAEQFLHPLLQVGKAEMRQHPAPVLGRPRLGDRPHRLVAFVDHGLERAVRAGALQVGRAAKAGCRMAHIDGWVQAPPGLHLPNVGDGDGDAGENGGTGLSDLEARREYGVRASDRHLAGLRRRKPAKACPYAHDLFECRRHGAVPP
jgi:hypothetical protein